MSTTKESAPLIYLALAAIIQDISAISKEKENKQQGFKFRGIDDVYNRLHPIFSAHGVVCIPNLAELRTSVGEKNAKGNAMNISHVLIEYQFLAKDGSSHTAKVPGEGSDYADKATAKALSAAQKYLFIQTFLIPVEDIAEGDYESTVYPAAELKERDEAQRATEELERQARKLEEKREAIRQKVEDGDAAKGATPAEPAERPARAEKAAEKSAAQADKSGVTAKKSEKAKPEKAPEKSAEPEWASFQIDAISHADFKGKKIGELTLEQLKYLDVNWTKRHAEPIAKNPAKSLLAKNLTLALEARTKESTYHK